MTTTARPKFRLPRKMADRVLEAVAIGAVIFGVVLVLRGWSSLPQTIPTHFDAAGNADGFGSKGMIWLMPTIIVILVPSMLILRCFPWLSNTPIKITDENAEYQYGLISRMLSVLACVVSLLFLVLVNDTISIAGGGTSLLGVWFMPAIIVPIIGTLLWYFVSTIRGR